MPNAFDHVANSIQVAIGALDNDQVPKIPPVVDAIEKLKEAKDQSVAASSTFSSEVKALKDQVADLEARLSQAPVAAPKEEKEEKDDEKDEDKDAPFFGKSDASHPSKKK